MPWGILVDSYKSSSRARILDWRSEDTVDTCGTDSPLLMFQPQCSDPFPEPRFAFPELRFALLSLALPPEKESKELPGSSLVTSGHPTAPPASSAASALLNNDALKPAVPSCHDFFVRQNERGQLPQQKTRALQMALNKTEMCVPFPAVACSYAESQRVTIS